MSSADARRETLATCDVAIVGAGVIGCALASELARRGASVLLLERERVASGASYGAGGMLAPQVEADGPGPLLELGLASRATFRDLRERLSDPLDLDLSGIVRVAHVEVAADELRRRAAWQQAQGLEARLLDAGEVAARAPGLARPPLAALWVPDGRIDPARLTAALADDAARHGAQVREGTPALAVRRGGVRTPAGRVAAGAVVVAAGAWSSELLPSVVDRGGTGAGRPPADAADAAAVPVRPVKGQRVLLRLPGHGLGQVVWGDRCYVVPRAGGLVLVGGTVEPEAGFDRRVTVEAVHRLLRAAIDLLPALADAEVVQAWAGLRPGTADGLPLIGPWPGTEGVWVASGHHRNGILLAPVTARLLADALLQGAALPASCLPERLFPSPPAGGAPER